MGQEKIFARVKTPLKPGRAKPLFRAGKRGLLGPTSAGGEAAASRSFTSGAWAKDGAIGLRHNSSLFPESTKILTALIREAFPSATFCSVAVFSDLKAEPHIHSNNDERFMNRILPLSSFQGGSV